MFSQNTQKTKTKMHKNNRHHSYGEIVPDAIIIICLSDASENKEPKSCSCVLSNIQLMVEYETSGEDS